MATHAADARAMLDDRGYTGALVRGQNPATLFEKAVRDRIVESYYWKEQCFGLNAASLCDRAAALTCIGGTYGMQKPTPFLCLAFKMLQLLPEREIVLEYLNWSDEADLHPSDQPESEELHDGGPQAHFKYLRALAAFYIRLVWEPVEIYQTLEPLLSDCRKLKQRKRDGFVLTYMDQFIDDLLTKERICATSLWKLPARMTLEDLDLLDPRVSPLHDKLEEMEATNGNGMAENGSLGASAASDSG